MMRAIKSSVRILKKRGFGSLLMEFFSYMKIYINRASHYPHIFLQAKKIKGTENALNFVFSKQINLIKPAQTRLEIKELLEILNEKRPKNILEIGIGEGGNLFLFSKIASDNAHIVGLDFGGKGLLWRTPLYKSFAHSNQKIDLINGDSHTNETLNRIKNLFREEKIDFLFIDGDHTYDGVKKDFEMYGPLVKLGGIIALHDIATINVEDCQVKKFWNEIKEKYSGLEIMYPDTNNVLRGIGVIRKTD